jgi:hypothetical protein
MTNTQNFQPLNRKEIKRELKKKGTHKLCTKCNTVKEILSFDKINPKKSNTRRGECKTCRKAINAAYYRRRKEKQKLKEQYNEISKLLPTFGQ